MILVDSSVWIDYFNGRKTDKTDWLDSAIGNKHILAGDLILAEILQGFQSDDDFRTAKNLLLDFPFMEMVGQDLAVKSAYFPLPKSTTFMVLRSITTSRIKDMFLT